MPVWRGPADLRAGAKDGRAPHGDLDHDQVPAMAQARAMKQANHAGVLSGDPRNHAMRATARTGRDPRWAQAAVQGRSGRSRLQASLECRDGGKPS